MTKWSKELIISEFNKLRDGDSDLRSSSMQKQCRPLFKAILKHYGSYRNFIEGLGIDYNLLSSKKASWTKEDIIKEFKQYMEIYNDLTPSVMQKNRNDLYIQIGRKFGSYKEFVESFGHNYEDVITHKQWSKEKIISELLNRHENGLSLRELDLVNENHALRSAAIKHFGTYANAVSACGIDYDNVRGLTFWDNDKIKLEFLKLYNDETVNKIEDIMERNRRLDHAVRKYYRSYDALCEELGLDVNKIRAEVYEWKAEDLIAVLKEMQSESLPLNVMSVQSRFPSAVKVAERYFGSYENALKEIGESYENHVNDHLYTSYLGKAFENLLDEMFKELDYSYIRHCRDVDGIIPDFYDAERNEIIDAKLSSWSVFNCETIQKYEPHCRKLIIVYLRGDDIPHSQDKLELRPVSYYYDELKKNNLSHFIEKFNELREKTA